MLSPILGSWYRSALRETVRSGEVRRYWHQDVLAGLLVAAVALPLSMGLAIASGCTPQQGLFTSVVGGVVVGLFGGSRVQIAGPAGAFVGLCAAGVARFGYDGLALATLMAGALMVLMGVLRLGRALSYVPTPVIIGFTGGIAVVIASTQLAPALGIRLHGPPAEQVLERVQAVWAARADLRLAPVAVCAATMLGIGLLRRFAPSWPGAVLTLTVVTAVCWALQVPADSIHDVYPHFASAVPAPHLPALHLAPGPWLPAVSHRLAELSGLALAIALLGSIESLLSATVADSLSGFRHQSNTELVAQGLANLVSPLCMGLPVTGVIARTSTNIRGGARTPSAAFVHAIAVLLCLVALGGIVGHIPLACLAGVLLMVCWSMAELRHWPDLLRARHGDALLLPLTFLLTVLVGLTYAVTIGVLLGVLVFLARMADAVRIHRHDGTDGEAPPPPGVQVYAVQGPFFFGAAQTIRDLDGALVERPRALVLRLGLVPFIDATAAFALKELATSCAHHGTALALCEVGEGCREDLARHGIVAAIGPERVTATLPEAYLAIAGSGPAAAVR